MPTLIDIVQLQWMAHPDGEINPLLATREPLPLVLFDAPCLMRARAIRALDEAGIPWRIAFTSQSLGGIWAAVQAGLGDHGAFRHRHAGQTCPGRRAALTGHLWGRAARSQP